METGEISDLARQLGAALGDGYVVERPLGAGGFAVVFLVRELALKRDLAIKVLSPDVITSRSMLDRFRREAETVAGLSHPNIVPLHFIGEKDDLLYIGMACIDGGSIGDRLVAEGKLPVDDAVRVIREVASALAHAHKRGVIHRDIKPANILIDGESGRCLVTDFGIARSVDAATLTATGIVLGTPAYLAPEQVMGEPLDHRADIFALGVMAYEMLAGRVPYEAPTPTAVMMKRLAGPPESLVNLRPDVPPAIADVVSRCLATDPNERFQNAGDVVSALGGELITSGGRSTLNIKAPAKPAPAPNARGPLKRFAPGLAVLILAGVGGFWWMSQARSTSDKAVVIPSRVAPAMIAIAAGDYIIGTDVGATLDRPRHTEHVAAFEIGRTEVTVADYRAFIAATHAPAPWGTDIVPDSTLPVTRVPWGDAANYCAWKYAPGGRLPTEVEWEAAARGTSGRDYPYGVSADAASGNTKSAARSGPAPVGSFPRGATPEGVQDMSGNVWEWTSSPMVAYPGAKALDDSMSRYRVIRGGAFDTADSLATGWMRGYLSATTSSAQLPNTGFRCAVSIGR